MDEPLPARPTPALTRHATLTAAAVSLAVAALILVLLLRLLHAGQAASGAPVYPLAGHPAPAFTINTWTWDGSPSQTVRLAALKGHPIVINFWASWCDACRAEEPLLEASWQQYQPQGVMFIGVAFEDQQPAGTEFLRQYGVTFPAGPDLTGAIAVAYGIIGVPETVFIDRHGIVVSKISGALDDGTLDRAVRALLR
jgi:cytochrome c biogenesis protein CcmG/thiol:disulfide interchange protein DsbE